MMVDFRPLDCATHEPLQFLPGFVNQTIYGDRVETGWSFEPYRQSYSSFWSPWAGIDGHNATCQVRTPTAQSMIIDSTKEAAHADKGEKVSQGNLYVAGV